MRHYLNPELLKALVHSHCSGKEGTVVTSHTPFLQKRKTSNWPEVMSVRQQREPVTDNLLPTSPEFWTLAVLKQAPYYRLPDYPEQVISCPGGQTLLPSS